MFLINYLTCIGNKKLDRTSLNWKFHTFQKKKFTPKLKEIFPQRKYFPGKQSMYCISVNKL